MPDSSPKRRNQGYYKRQAEAIYRLQMREAVVRMSQEGLSDDEIAQALGQSSATIRGFRSKAMAGPPKALPPPPEPRRKVPPRGSGPGPHRPRSPKAAVEVLDSPDVIELRKQCLSLRKALVPFDEMAQTLGISEREARLRTAEALRQLSDSETTNAELERRLMVEQLDEMIRAAYASATARSEKGLAPNLDATDRILKLLDRKAKLLGLDQVPAQDIRIKLQTLAHEGNYDMAELEDIAREVLARHRFAIIEPSQVDDVS